MTRRTGLTALAIALTAGALLALGALAMSGAVLYYVTPSELAAAPGTDAVRLYGVVDPGSVERTDEELRFSLTDGATTVPVETRALPTALFGDGVGVVLTGRLAGNAFVADDVLVKHSEVYEPVAPGQTIPPGVLRELTEAAP